MRACREAVAASSTGSAISIKSRRTYLLWDAEGSRGLACPPGSALCGCPAPTAEGRRVPGPGLSARVPSLRLRRSGPPRATALAAREALALRLQGVEQLGLLGRSRGESRIQRAGVTEAPAGHLGHLCVVPGVERREPAAPAPRLR